MNASGSVFAANYIFREPAGQGGINPYDKSGIWGWKKWQYEEKQDVPFTKSERGNNRYFLYSLNDEGDIAVGTHIFYDTPYTSLYLAALWTKEGSKWGEPFKLPHLDQARAFAIPKGLNGKGDIVVGYNDTDAVIWKKENGKWAVEKFNKLDENARDAAYKTDRTGNIVIGRTGLIGLHWADITYDTGTAVFWRLNSSSPKDPTKLTTTLNSNKVNEETRANGINKNGTVIGGWSFYEEKQTDRIYAPTVWHGENFSKFTLLKDVNGDISTGEVHVFNEDGTVAAGSVGHRNQADLDDQQATLWFGKDWTPYNLGTFKKDGSGRSKVLTMNDNGTILGGFATGEDDEKYAALWFVRYANGKAEGNIITDQTDVPDIDVISINLTDTQTSVKKMAGVHSALLAEQYQGLNRLHQSCYTAEKGFGYRAYGDFAKANYGNSTHAGLSLGYQFGQGVLVGANFDHSLQGSFNYGQKQSSNNAGIGVFARVQHQNWYIAPSIAWNYSHANVKREQLNFTESQENRTKLEGVSFALTVGQDIPLANKAELGWYATLGSTKVELGAYKESGLTLPIEYAGMRLREETLALGAKLQLPLAEKLKLVASAQIEQQISGNAPVYHAKGYAVDVQQKLNLNRTRAKAELGLAYEVKPNLEISFLPYVERGIFGNQRYGAQLVLSGRF